MTFISFAINGLAYWTFLTVRNNSYIGTRTSLKKCPLPLWEVVLLGLLVFCPLGFIPILLWLIISISFTYEVREIKLPDEHFLKRMYKILNKNLASKEKTKI